MPSFVNKRQKLTFLPLGASIIAAVILLFAGDSRASTNEMQLVADMAGMHCKLWLGHIEKKQVPLSTEELSVLLKRNIDAEEAEQFRYRFNGLPDFGFVLGQRWQVASLADRQNFNFYFSQWLDKQYNFHSPETTESEFCNFNINLTALPSAPETPAISPQPRRLKAIAQTTLPGAQGYVVVIYELRQDHLGWKIHEIYVNGEGLSNHHQLEFGQKIADSGFRGLITYLINAAANS